VSPGSTRIIQYGNTSLALARELTMGRIELDDLRQFAQKLRATHCMFATSETFKNLYSIELSLWSYGMPLTSYNDMLDIYGLPHLRLEPVKATIVRKVRRDIPDLGSMGISVLHDPGTILSAELDGCIQCGKCVESCPEDALAILDEEPHPRAAVRSDLCLGTACKRCELVCPEHVMKIRSLKVSR